MSQVPIRLVSAGWDRELTAAIHADPSEIRIICPFIKKGALDYLMPHRPRDGDIQVITRFNLDDFAEGVSDVEALRMLLDDGASVRGVQNLHTKLYLFGTSRAIITSANLTEAALTRNQEFGVVAEDEAVIADCQSYFDGLWRRGKDLSQDLLDSWAATVTQHRAAVGRPNRAKGLGDFGAKVRLAASQSVQAFVKFLGNSHERVPVSYAIIKVIKHEGCHRELAYPKRPVSVKDDALMFMGRFTDEPDIRIFGRAIGMKHQPDLDDASPEDIKRREWREKYSNYIRVQNAEFVAGTIANGISLYKLMDELGSDSFASTQRNAACGTGNTNPRRAYGQQPAVKLSSQAIAWIGERLQAAFDAHGKVPQDTLDQID